MKNYKVITPLFQHTNMTLAMMKAVAICSVKAVRNMITAIQEQTGPPQNPVDWSEPDNWIKERLSGEDASIAWQIWNMDNYILNPRHSYGCYMFINNPLFDLMQTAEDDGWYPSEQGRLLMDHDEATLHKLGDIEGMLHATGVTGWP